MKEVLSFLTSNPTVFFGTVEGDLPKVRPFQFIYADGEKLFFATSSEKPVYKQLLANPNVELSSMSPKMEWIRVSGRVKFIEEMEVKKSVFEKAPLAQRVFQTPENPIMKTFYLENWEAVIAGFALEKEIVFKSETV